MLDLFNSIELVVDHILDLLDPLFLGGHLPVVRELSLFLLLANLHALGSLLC